MPAELPKLPPFGPRNALIESYRGPTKRSNWVVLGCILAGDRSSLDKEDGLKAIVAAGVSVIVNLQTKQENKAAVAYDRRAKALNAEIEVRVQPIPDQEVTEDHLVEVLLDDLLEKIQAGHILYVHCRGGHGRTGTICSLLLGRLYNLSAAEAMVRFQLYHDTRAQPVFAAEGYKMGEEGSCIALFPAQREQVLRLLATAPAPEPPAPPALVRSVSEKYGPGASRRTADELRRLESLAGAAKKAELRAGEEADIKKQRAALQEAVASYSEAKAILNRPMAGLDRVLRELRCLEPFMPNDSFEALLEETHEIKFPSTPHLKNLGAATKDDKLLDAKRRAAFVGSGTVISVEEKIDGANLGISLGRNYEPRFQGRSKWVSSASDPQFSGLDHWLNEHKVALREILERNCDILFGEWCAHLHTVKYDRLPAYFLAFDIYSVREKRFLSRESLHRRLRSASKLIPAVPLLGRRAFTEAEVDAFLTRQTTFGPEHLEGVYLRIDEQSNPDGESFLVDRCKLVRGEFQQAIVEDGSWRGRGKNGLDFDFCLTYLKMCHSLAEPECAESLSDGQSTDVAEEAALLIEPIGHGERPVSPSFDLPSPFATWLAESLHRELGDSGAEGMLATLEVMLSDVQHVDELSYAREILESQGAMSRAGELEQRYKQARE